MYVDRLAQHLADLERKGRRREVRTEALRARIDFSSNDYLGLRAHPSVVGAMTHGNVVGSSGSRLLSGAAPEHAQLEGALAAYTRREAALVFSSGYLAAIGVITALAPYVDAIFSDAANHASLIDGMRLTKLPRSIFAHVQIPTFDGATRRKLVITESIFGMDGDCADPRALLAALGPNDILIVDEAHALGITGRDGAGLCAGIDDARLIVLGTLSKAFGAAGGFIAGPRILIDYLANVARTFIFDTALPPAIAAAATVAVGLAREASSARDGLAEVARYARESIVGCGYDTGKSVSHIIPIVVGADRATVELQRALLARDILAPAIRPPSVDEGAARLRVTLTAQHTRADVAALVEGLRACRSRTVS